MIVALVANLACAALVATSQGGPAYLAVDAWSAGATSPNTVARSATTGVAIPKQPDEFIGSNAIVGIAWADLSTGTVLVATSHPVIGRDSDSKTPRGGSPRGVDFPGSRSDRASDRAAARA